MPQIDIPTDEFDRLEELSAALADEYAGEYASVTSTDAIAFLLDLAASVEDPYRIPVDDRSASVDDGTVDDRGADAPRPSERTDVDGPGDGFPRDSLEAVLRERNREGGDDEMDLYTIAAEYDVTGRSEMTKDELIDAILAETRERYTDPFAPVDVPFPPERDGSVSDADAGSTEQPDETGATSKNDGRDDGNVREDENGREDDGGNGDASAADTANGAGEGDGDAQLDAMLHLLDTHDDKWSRSDGDARYEVELPDGTHESARTKDDVRALLFKHY
ncbi:hypothetical protein GJ633_03310 [Halorubrum sp. CBA1125]|uniref:Rho termination factor N-terminal domain-containing protein n=1 Tax=Halorubrum sp. CBA1125 TaxID=2668072 RepID=UPI0012E8BFF2|nr:Rho termination factor N-terminal domain-containing protein [Halorubrum sp. CBA1125]MUW13797.1 hypothetical protein [Halorubrum sp. CBA1125]